MNTALAKQSEVLHKLHQHFPLSLDESTSPADPALLIATLGTLNGALPGAGSALNRIITAGSDEFGRLEPGADQRRIIDWVELAFEQLGRHYPLHPALDIKLHALMPAVAAEALLDADRIYSGDHPLIKLVDLVFTHAVGWDRSLGRASQALISQLDVIDQHLSGYFDEDGTDIEGCYQQLRGLLTREQKNIDRLRERVAAGEQGKLKARSARANAASLLNDTMVGKRFPPSMISFLQKDWYDCLQLILLKRGRESNEWTEAVTLTGTLIWTLQPYSQRDEQHKQRLFRLIPSIAKQLRRTMSSLQTDPKSLEEAVAKIEQAHMVIMRGETLDGIEFTDLDASTLAPGARISETMLELMDGVAEGQWFALRQDNGKILRVQLALRLDEFEQLLFINRAGVKVLEKTFGEFAVLLSSGALYRLFNEQALSSCLREVLGENAPQRPIGGDSATSTGDADLNRVSEPHSRRVKTSVPEDSVKAPATTVKRGGLRKPIPVLKPVQIGKKPAPANDPALSPADAAPKPAKTQAIPTAPKVAAPQQREATVVDAPDTRPVPVAPVAQKPIEQTAVEPPIAPPSIAIAAEEERAANNHNDTVPDVPGIPRSGDFTVADFAALEDVAEIDLEQELELFLTDEGELEDTESTLDPKAVNRNKDTTEKALGTKDSKTKNSLFSIGEWVIFTDGDTPTRCKLVVRVDSLDHYLFVNEQGQREREVSGQKLKKMIADGQCSGEKEAIDFSDEVTTIMSEVTHQGDSDNDGL